MTWHQTIIVGNLGQDPEMRYLQDGNSVCSFRVAVNERWNDRRTGEKRERTTWYRVSAWAALGETCNRYLSKGRQVMAIGSVSVNAFTNREGEPAASLELRAREVRFIGGDRGSRDEFDKGDRSGGHSRESFAPPAARSDPAPAAQRDDDSVYIPEQRKSRETFDTRYEEVDDLPF